MTLIPALIPFQHLVWSPTGVKDDHGNDPGKMSDPIDHKAIEIHPLHWRNPHVDPISADYMDRTETDILIEVEEPGLYKKLDQVIVNGIDYDVQGIPANWGLASHFSSMPTADW